VGADQAPPIAGARSLLFPPREQVGGNDVRFSARLAVTPGDRVLRAKVRLVVSNPSWRQEFISLGVYGAGPQPLWLRMPAATSETPCEPGRRRLVKWGGAG
jgi:hypothetical protein